MMKTRKPFTHHSLKPSRFVGQEVVKTWSRASIIPSYMIKHTVCVHNGHSFTKVQITEDKVGYRLGEFARTRKRGADPRGKSKRIRRF